MHTAQMYTPPVRQTWRQRLASALPALSRGARKAGALLPMAALPSGGFVLLGLLAAGWCAVANLYTDYKHEEVRRLYADRKH